MKAKSKTVTTFYGQDLTPIDEACVLTANGTLSKCDAGQIKDLKKFLDKINDFLNKNNNDLIVGTAPGKKLKNKYRIYEYSSDQTDDNQPSAEDPENTSPYRFGPLVGTVRIGNQKLILYSRFDSTITPGTRTEKNQPFFVASLLLRGKLKFSRNLNVDFNDNSIFDFYMLWVLKNHFEKACQKGFFKKYQRFERNDDRPRGTLDISRHIRLNLGMENGKIAYSVRDNTPDNAINHLILTAYDYLKKKYPELVYENFDNNMEQVLKQLKYEIGYPRYDRKTILAKTRLPIAHPYFTEYEQIRKDCHLILRDDGVSPFGNEKEDIEGLLYYVPDLWEEYVEDFIRPKLSRFNKEQDDYSFSFEAQKPIRVLTDIDGYGGNSTEPDFVFSYKESSDTKDIPYLIIDAKYKNKWDRALKGESFDLLEDYTKCARDMTSVAGTGFGVIFPIRQSGYNEIHNPQIIHGISVENPYGYFYSLPIVVPDPTDNVRFAVWEREMSGSAARALDTLLSIVDYEQKRHVDYLACLKKINKSFPISMLADTLSSLSEENEE